MSGEYVAIGGYLTAVKCLDPRIVDVRYVLRDGTPVLQAGRAWVQGGEHGIEWSDVPIVEEEK
jgi:hypothetical protein